MIFIKYFINKTTDGDIFSVYVYICTSLNGGGVISSKKSCTILANTILFHWLFLNGQRAVFHAGMTAHVVLVKYG